MHIPVLIFYGDLKDLNFSLNNSMFSYNASVELIFLKENMNLNPVIIINMNSNYTGTRIILQQLTFFISVQANSISSSRNVVMDLASYLDELKKKRMSSMCVFLSITFLVQSWFFFTIFASHLLRFRFFTWV